MNDTSTIAAARRRAAPPGAPGLPPEGPRDAWRRLASLAALRSLVATWGARMRLRRALAQMSKRNPHLIEDIGLTRRQAELEIAKPFWR